MKKKFIFKNSQFYEKNIIYFSKNLRNILNKLRLKPKNLQVLDFGCGNCSFECGAYPNKEELDKILHKDRDVSILSITELNEIDYNNFIRKS